MSRETEFEMTSTTHKPASPACRYNELPRLTSQKRKRDIETRYSSLGACSLARSLPCLSLPIDKQHQQQQKILKKKNKSKDKQRPSRLLGHLVKSRNRFLVRHTTTLSARSDVTVCCMWMSNLFHQPINPTRCLTSSQTAGQQEVYNGISIRNTTTPS